MRPIDSCRVNAVNDIGSATSHFLSEWVTQPPGSADTPE
jgi:hypothetical protein